MAESVEKVDALLVVAFRIHDGLSDFLARHFTRVKTGLLLAAHASLFGFFFPGLRNGFGNAALLLLLGILFLSPLSKIFRMRLLIQVMGLRRQLGIWFAYLATVHGIGYLLDPAWFDISHSGWAGLEGIATPYSLGLMAYALTLPLLLTSNNISLKFLKANWKRVQMLVYPVLVFVLLHTFLVSRFAMTPARQSAGVTQAVLVLGVYILLKILARKNFLPPLERSIRYVSERYGAYQAESRSVMGENKMYS